MAEVEVNYNSDPVLSQLNSHKTMVDSLTSNIHLLLDSIGDLAESLLDTKGIQQVEAAQASAKTLLEVEAESKAYKAALETMHSQYVASERTTDFKKDLEQHANRMVSTFRQKPEACEAYQDLCSKLDIEEEEEEEEMGSDDEVQVKRGVMNELCPLTGRPRLEIEDPVEDEKGYTYEKSAIINYIKEEGRNGSVKCPAGASHQVTAAGLKKASKLIREQRRHKQASQYGTQKQSQADVVDVD